MRAMFSIFALLTIINGALFGISVKFIDDCPLWFFGLVSIAFSISWLLSLYFLDKIQKANTLRLSRKHNV